MLPDRLDGRSPQRSVTIAWLVKKANKVGPPAREIVEPVSELTTNRLSVYLRCLNDARRGRRADVSSQALAEQFHLNAAQIRKDLAHFGEFGVRGVGYYVKELRRHLRQILGLDRRVRVAIMGAGNLGLALADYAGFRRRRIRDRGALRHRAREDRPALAVGVPIHDIRDFKRVVRREGIAIAVIAVPAPIGPGGGQQRGRRRACKAILNFSPGALNVPPDVKLKSVDLTVSLESLSFFLAQRRGRTMTASRAQPHERPAAPRRADAVARRRRRAACRWWTSSAKAVTAREAVARGRIRMSAAALRQVRAGNVKKGDPLQTARLAGIMAAKQTADADSALPSAAALARRRRARPLERRLRDRGPRPHHRADRRRDGSADGRRRRGADRLRHGQGGGQGDGHRRHPPGREARRQERRHRATVRDYGA